MAKRVLAYLLPPVFEDFDWRGHLPFCFGLRRCASDPGGGPHDALLQGLV